MLRNIVLRIVVSGVAVFVTAALLPGITIQDDGVVTLVIIAVILAAVNAVARPVLKILTCPLSCLTLGLFILVFNGISFSVVAHFAGDRITIDGFGWAVLGGSIISIVSMVMEFLLGLGKDGD